MADNSELFRNSFASQLMNVLPQDKLIDVMKIFDSTSSGYDIQRKPTDIIVTGVIPDAIKWFIASKSVANCSMKTLQQYRYKLVNFFNDVKKPFADITSNDIRMYLNYYKTSHNICDHTLEHTRTILCTFFQWCVDNELLIRNPCANVEHVKFQEQVREGFSAYGLEVLRWNCKNIREKALIDFIYSTGCRVSECSDVNLSDIDWIDRSVIIRHGKGDKRRVVFFNAESELTLRKYLETRKGDSDALFTRCRAPFSRLSPRAIENEIKKIGDRSSERAFPHKLRHTFGTHSINSGMPIEKLQALMGHSNPKTTLIYAKQDTSVLKMEHRKVFA